MKHLGHIMKIHGQWCPFSPQRGFSGPRHPYRICLVSCSSSFRASREFHEGASCLRANSRERPLASPLLPPLLQPCGARCPRQGRHRKCMSACAPPPTEAGLPAPAPAGAQHPANCPVCPKSLRGLGKGQSDASLEAFLYPVLRRSHGSDGNCRGRQGGRDNSFLGPLLR